MILIKQDGFRDNNPLIVSYSWRQKYE